MNESITVIRRGEKNKFGDYPDRSEFRVSDCFFAPLASTETRNYSNTVITGMTLYAPFGTIIKNTDAIRRDRTGEEFEVTGEVATWENPLTHTSFGVTVTLERKRG